MLYWLPKLKQALLANDFFFFPDVTTSALRLVLESLSQEGVQFCSHILNQPKVDHT